MKKLIATLPEKPNTRLRFPLRNITNQKPDPGRKLALEHNKTLLATYQKNLASEMSELVPKN